MSCDSEKVVIWSCKILTVYRLNCHIQLVMFINFAFGSLCVGAKGMLYECTSPIGQCRISGFQSMIYSSQLLSIKLVSAWPSSTDYEKRLSKQGIIFHNKGSYWACFLLDIRVIFFQMFELLLCPMFVDNSLITSAAVFALSPFSQR